VQAGIITLAAAIRHFGNQIQRIGGSAVQALKDCFSGAPSLPTSAPAPQPPPEVPYDRFFDPAQTLKPGSITYPGWLAPGTANIHAVRARDLSQQAAEMLWRGRELYLSDPKSAWIDATLKATGDYRWGLVGTDQAAASEQIRLILEFADYLFGKQ